LLVVTYCQSQYMFKNVAGSDITISQVYERSYFSSSIHFSLNSFLAIFGKFLKYSYRILYI